MIALIGVLGLFLVACSAETNEVQLTFADNEALAGFRCVRSEDKQALAEHAWQAQGSVALNLVIDFVEFRGGAPSCRLSEIERWCTRGDCELVLTSRRCVGLQVPAMGRASDRVAAALHALPTAPLTTDAPDGTVMVRVVGTSQPCSAFTNGEPFSVEHLIGCAYACPVTLDQVRGELTLDLDAFDPQCEDTVRACAF